MASLLYHFQQKQMCSLTGNYSCVCCVGAACELEVVSLDSYWPFKSSNVTSQIITRVACSSEKFTR